MKCERVREEIKACVDGELGRVARWRLARHLAACAGCRMEEKTMTDLTGQVQSASKAAAPPGLREKVLGRIEFKPAAGRPRWTLVGKPAIVVALAILVAVVVFPTLQPARERGHRAPQMAMPYPTAKPPSPSTVAPVPRLPRSGEEGVRAEASLRKPAEAGSPSYFNPDYSEAASPPFQARRAMPAPAVTPLIIKTADISIKVRNFQKAYDDAVWICRSVGGFVSDSTAESEESIPTSGSLTLRVPADSFESAIGRLSRLGTVKSKNIKGQDVTGEVVDLESRLRNKRAEERQYLEIMNRARRVPDIVTVTEELSRVRGEIEEAQGRLRYLRASAAMATINVSLSEKERPKPVPKSSINRTFKNAVASLGRTASGLAAVCIWLGVYSPFWALPIAAWLYLRKRQPAAQ